MIELNEYLAIFPASDINRKIVEMELCGILLHIMTNSWITQAFVQGFDFDRVHTKMSISLPFSGINQE